MLQYGVLSCLWVTFCWFNEYQMELDHRFRLCLDVYSAPSRSHNSFTVWHIWLHYVHFLLAALSLLLCIVIPTMRHTYTRRWGIIGANPYQHWLMCHLSIKAWLYLITFVHLTVFNLYTDKKIWCVYIHFYETCYTRYAIECYGAEWHFMFVSHTIISSRGPSWYNPILNSMVMTGNQSFQKNQYRKWRKGKRYAAIYRKNICCKTTFIQAIDKKSLPVLPFIDIYYSFLRMERYVSNYLLLHLLAPLPILKVAITWRRSEERMHICH